VANLISRLYSFVTDSAAGIKISSAKVDGELDQLLSTINKNLIISATTPGTASDGLTWVDNSVHPPVIKVYDGNAAAWVDIALPALTTQGDIVYFNGTALARLPAGTAGKVLKTGGAGANPSWGLPEDLVIASQAQGDIIYFNGTNWVRLAPGTSGYYLQTKGAAANPIWAAQASSIYDSGWFAVSANATYTKAHGLASTPSRTWMLLAQNSDGSGWCITGAQNLEIWGDDRPEGQIMIVEITATNIVVRTLQERSQDTFFDFRDKSGVRQKGNSAYCKIVAQVS